jgi:hypothetical protein
MSRVKIGARRVAALAFFTSCMSAAFAQTTAVPVFTIDWAVITAVTTALLAGAVGAALIFFGSRWGGKYVLKIWRMIAG